MNPAARAAFRSKSLALADTLRLAPADLSQAAIRLAVEASAKAGMDAGALRALLDETLAAAAVEGVGGGDE